MPDAPSGALVTPQEHMQQAFLHAQRADDRDLRNGSAQAEANLALTHALIAHTIQMVRQGGGNPYRGYEDR